MQINKALIAILAIAIYMVALPVTAQDKQEDDGIAQVAHITARDGQAKALEEAITDYHHYMGDKKGAWHWNWYEVMTGPDTGTYIARSGSHNWEDLDAADMETDWGKAAAAKFAKEVQPHIADLDVSITRTEMDLGMWPESMDGYKYFQITRWYVRPGSQSEFYQGLKKIDGILKKSGWKNHYAFVYVVSGGHGNEVLLVSPHKNFADMAPKEPNFMTVMNQAMGEDEAKAFFAKWGQTFKSGDDWMLRYRPDLSDYGQAK